MNYSYITVLGTACEEIVISKSHFIGYAASFSDESSAIDFLQTIRNEHKTAKHHCYAYIIGENSGIMRYSDDGEPAGTAGLPIMDVLRAKNVVNCCIVVVRYFGGILLGTGGLVRAYQRCAQETLSSAGLSRMELSTVDYCEVPYSVWDKVRYTAEHMPVRIEKIEFGSAVVFQLICRTADRDSVICRLTEASGRKLCNEKKDERFLSWDISE